MDLNAITRLIIGAAIEVHRELGPGKPEAAYERALSCELELRGIEFQAQKPLPVIYKGVRLECGYRLDLLVRDLVVVEVKAVEVLAPVHDAQTLTYLKLGPWTLGLLLNFNVAVLKQGIRRLVLGFEEAGRAVPGTGAAPRTPDVASERASGRGTRAGGAGRDGQACWAVVEAALEVHRRLGPGLLASAYDVCLCHELNLRQIPFERRVQVPLSYKGKALAETAEISLLVDRQVVVAPKAVQQLLPVHEADVLSQLRLGGWPEGLLLNFNTVLLHDGLRRLVNHT